MVSGLFSIAMGILFAVNQEMSDSLFTLFRVSHLSGSLFIIAGLLSNLLFKYPRLLPVSLVVNCGCIVVAIAAVCLINIDLAFWHQENEQYLKMEVMELIVLGIEISLSSVLCFMFIKERRSKSHQSL
ncbi:uncharacterized protein si:ch211-269k10.4 [Thalassophryne amazonica]|uniref:uncharacterized protein si:ch211-269k10.4 n=1 Tax=Thalassophryne amazonica TaxID=390379 RepID=UPI0014713EB2|nr:uncharacterized protein si:ch211-269k10.4 [Thalassophryne amazonica]